MRDAISRLNRSPPLRSHVDTDKHVGSDQGRGAPVDLSRMAAPFQIAREIDIESLSHEIERRLRLLVDLRLHNIPCARACRVHCATTPRSRAGKRRRRGANTRSAPWSRTDSSKVRRASTISVITTASNATEISSWV